MGSGGTLNVADVYGDSAPILQFASPISASGPNQSFVAPAFSPPGTMQVSGGKAPALSLVGLVIALLIWRVAINLGGEA